MRSLALKLTLAFLLVGLIGAGLVAVFVGFRTQTEFDKFVLNRFQTEVIQNLTEYYTSNGSWDNLSAIVVRNPARRGERGYVRAVITLADEGGKVVYGGRRHQAGDQLTRQELNQAVPVEVENEQVGYVLFADSPSPAPPPAVSPETDFLNRVQQAILFGALGAVAVALLLGILLARTISRPVRELTVATQRVAQGELGHQVEVRTRDEVGELAASFNQMSADLDRASRLRRQMTADIAHDLRTPLTVILGYTEGLADGKFQGEPEIYESMHEEAQHLRHLIDDLRTLSLADAGELSLLRQRCEPRALLQRTAAAHKPQADAKSISVTVETPEHLPEIDVDPERMAQVLGNLMSNALRYTPEGGAVTLAAAPTAGKVNLYVRDNGAGIAPEDLPNIFARFYRGDEARDVREGESGLGLAITKSLVQAHGGEISVESNLGEGTMFTISLPIE